MDKKYQPQKVENRIYSLWEKGGYFTPKIDKTKKPFVITLPPPNVTGGLHVGHAMYVFEDIIVRYHRMKGEPTLFLPGFDHASIAVEYLVSKQLQKEGKSKQTIGRQEFLKRAQKYAQESKKEIRQELKKLGFSLDWAREAYTMDKSYSQAVKTAFNRLYKKDLIYQGEQIINWCTHCQTTLSDLEVEYEEKKDPLYYLKYGPFTLATVRPETKFGDTAVAVNPKDKSYQKWVGKEFTYQSLIGPRQMKVVADKLVDPNFGTGVVKVTPAHDPNDFEIAKRHGLKVLKVINTDGKLNEVTGRFAGLTIEEAREKVVNELKKKGDLVKIDQNYLHRVGKCYRCSTTVEPIISKQWFVKSKPLAQKAIESVKSGQIKIIPKRFEKVYFHWLENIRDWCISRQLWWGHKIPLKGETDILDTWFSSALWPIAVFGWPKKTTDFEYFYPTSVRETGYDILFFWVAREIMMCLGMTGKIPFKIIYLHGLVRDEKNRKFSKTAGIGFGPLEIIENYGSDALRIALVTGNAPGHDLKVNENKVIAYRNFANKIWNAARFTLASLKNAEINAEKRRKLRVIPRKAPRHSALHPEDEWILREMNKVIDSVTKKIEGFRFDLAAEEIYQFFWHIFCDQYLEKIKPRLKNGNAKEKESALCTLHFALCTCLKLLHPFMPFVTEEIYQRLKETVKTDLSQEEALIISPWPKQLKI